MTVTKTALKNLDKEGEQYFKELLPKVLEMDVTIEDILGFKLAKKKSKGYSHNAPNKAILTMYDQLFIPISNADDTPLKFKNEYQFTPQEIATLAESGKVMPYFVHEYDSYKPDIIEPLLKLGVPYISHYQGLLLGFLNASDPEYLPWPLFLPKEARPSEPRLSEFQGIPDSPCFRSILAHGFKEPLASVLEDIREKRLTTHYPECLFCFARVMHSRIVPYKLGTILHSIPSRCPQLQSLLNKLPSEQCIFGEAFFGSSKNIETVIKGLRIYYSPDLSLKYYAEIFDGKTAEAVRKTIHRILQDPLATKYQQQLGAKIYELNMQIEEIRKSKLAKLASVASDMVSYKLERKILPNIAKKGIEWLADVSLEIQAKLAKKDWAAIHLYRARKRMGRI